MSFFYLLGYKGQLKRTKKKKYYTNVGIYVKCCKFKTPFGKFTKTFYWPK